MRPNQLGPEYGSLEDDTFLPIHHASCHCGAVRYEVRDEPVDAKICHCRDCQTLHGAPMQWAAIFRKSDVRFVAGVEHLHFYASQLARRERVLPCKVSCALCGTLIADEGRRMWLAFPTLFDFASPPREGSVSGPPRSQHSWVAPSSFAPTCHIFYGSRAIDVADVLPKWEGHKGKSRQL